MDNLATPDCAALGQPDQYKELRWILTYGCNLDCEYCYQQDQRSQRDSPNNLSESQVQRVKEFICSDLRSWTVYFTGGDPFSFPGFVDLCASIAGDCYIGLQTNLASEEVARFVTLIPADRVQYPAFSLAGEDLVLSGVNYGIDVTYHPGALFRKGLHERFIANLLLLKEKGYRFQINCVLYPASYRWIMDRISDLELLGFDINPRVFRGWWDGRFFPRSYTAEQIKYISSTASNSLDDDFGSNGYLRTYYGQPCETGKRFLCLDPTGHFYRCDTHLRSGEQPLNLSLSDALSAGLSRGQSECPFPYCECVYQGMKYARNGKCY